ncbi:hypothetical protein Bbelb_290380 [Branchiostoma belcheri]|nr:hypothetical protein Bbelb_290380 [Branchiostoma belcheri]
MTTSVINVARLRGSPVQDPGQAAIRGAWWRQGFDAFDQERSITPGLAIEPLGLGKSLLLLRLLVGVGRDITQTERPDCDISERGHSAVKHVESVGKPNTAVLESGGLVTVWSCEGIQELPWLFRKPTLVPLVGVERDSLSDHTCWDRQRLAVTQETSQEDEPTDDPVPGPSRVNTELNQRLAVTQETSQEDEPTDDPVPGPSRVNTELNRSLIADQPGFQMTWGWGAVFLGSFTTGGATSIAWYLPADLGKRTKANKAGYQATTSNQLLVYVFLPIKTPTAAS